MKQAGLYLAVLLICLGQVSQAADRNYEAELADARWDLQGSAINCRLAQDIPQYGSAVFTSDASRRPNLNFDLQLRGYSPQRIVEASVSSEAPEWRHDRPVQHMGTVTMFPSSTPINIKDDEAWQLLTQLEVGMDPTFRYSGLVNEQDNIKVALSSANFQPVYDEFLQCVSHLLPYSFDDISESVVHFEHGSNKFTRKTRQALSRISAWLAADKSLDMVLLSGHTDNTGSLKSNLRLGKKRAEIVKQYLVKAGIPASKIKVQSFADFQPVSSNATPEGRARNRRVMIRMVK